VPERVVDLRLRYEFGLQFTPGWRRRHTEKTIRYLYNILILKNKITIQQGILI